MTKVEYDALPQMAVPENAEKLRESARFSRDQASRCYSPRCLSGADTADAPKYDLEADALGCIADGKDIDATLALCRRKWERYCAENNARIADAPKTNRGPYSGQSSLHYRHTSPDAFDAIERFVRSMVAS